MSKIDVTSFFVYRWRYWIGYIGIGLALAAVLVIAGLYIPGGLSEREINAVIMSDGLNLTLTDPTTFSITNMPYHILQLLSITVFGVSTLSIKLPSLILGFITAVSMLLLVRQWFTQNVAVLASVIAVTTGQFLFLAQEGAPGILYLFWPTVLLLLATYIVRRVKYGLLWKALFAICAALSLYTPLSLYVLIALGCAVLFHPHLRYLARRLPKTQVIVAVLIAIFLIVPLGWIVLENPSLGLSLLGIPEQWPSLLDNLAILGQQYFGFMSIGSGSLMTPVFGLGSMLLIGYGLYQLIKTRETVQSYVVLIWLLCLLPVLIINPQYTSITFVPLLLLLATGLRHLLSTWYGLFPRNPYARIGGLIPLVILVSSLVLFGLNRYMYGYQYAPETVKHFSRDLRLLPPETSVLKVHPDELSFYEVVASHADNFEVTTNTPEDGDYTATRKAKTESEIPTRIITSSMAYEADRFYIYKDD